MKTVKQTAANNKVLAAIKREMNHLVYAHCLGIMNSEGEQAVRAYVGQFFNDEYRAAAMTKFFATAV